MASKPHKPNHHQNPPSINPERLCDASVVCLRAAAEAGNLTGDSWPFPLDLWDTDLGERHFRGFLKIEIAEASRFLVRLGYINKAA
jgi:hypothetical protein